MTAAGAKRASSEQTRALLFKQVVGTGVRGQVGPRESEEQNLASAGHKATPSAVRPGTTVRGRHLT